MEDTKNTSLEAQATQKYNQLTNQTVTNPYNIEPLKGIKSGDIDLYQLASSGNPSDVALAYELNSYNNKSINQIAQEAGEVTEEDLAGIRVRGFGDSRFDKRFTRLSQLQDLDNARDDKQTAIAKLGNGLVKMGVTAATTFVNTVPLLYGVVDAIAEGDASKIFDNDLSRGLDKVNDWAEKTFKNYGDEDMQNATIWQRMGTMNFWAEQVKNAGFTIGSILPGAWASKGLSMIKMAPKIGKWVTNLGGSIYSAALEGGVEALQASKDFENLQSSLVTQDYIQKAADIDRTYKDMSARLDQDLIENDSIIQGFSSKYQLALSNPNLSAANKEALTQEYMNQVHNRTEEIRNSDLYKATAAKFKADMDTATNDLRMDHQNDMEKIRQLSKSVGERVMGANMIILPITNNLEFGRLFTGKYAAGAASKVAAQSGNKVVRGIQQAFNAVVGGEGAFRAEGKALGGWVLRGTAKGLEEASEEFLQDVASTGSQLRGAAELNEFSNKKYNAIERDKVDNVIDASLAAIDQDFKDATGSGWQDVFGGFFMGAVGLPGVHKTQTGKIGISWNGGYLGEYLDQKKDQNTWDKDSIDALNRSAQDLKAMKERNENLKDYATANNAIQKDLDESLAKGTIEGATDAKVSDLQLVANDVLLWKKAGMLKQYLSFFDDFKNMSDEDIKKLNDATKTQDQEGRVDPNDEGFFGTDFKEARKRIDARVDDIQKKAQDVSDLYDFLSAQHSATNSSIFAKSKDIWTEDRIQDMAVSQATLLDLMDQQKEVETGGLVQLIQLMGSSLKKEDQEALAKELAIWTGRDMFEGIALGELDQQLKNAKEPISEKGRSFNERMARISARLNTKKTNPGRTLLKLLNENKQKLTDTQKTTLAEITARVEANDKFLKSITSAKDFVAINPNDVIDGNETRTNLPIVKLVNDLIARTNAKSTLTSDKNAQVQNDKHIEEDIQELQREREDKTTTQINPTAGISYAEFTSLRKKANIAEDDTKISYIENKNEKGELQDTSEVSENSSPIVVSKDANGKAIGKPQYGKIIVKLGKADMEKRKKQTETLNTLGSIFTYNFDQVQDLVFSSAILDNYTDYYVDHIKKLEEGKIEPAREKEKENHQKAGKDFKKKREAKKAAKKQAEQQGTTLTGDQPIVEGDASKKAENPFTPEEEAKKEDGTNPPTNPPTPPAAGGAAEGGATSNTEEGNPGSDVPADPQSNTSTPPPSTPAQPSNEGTAQAGGESGMSDKEKESLKTRLREETLSSILEGFGAFARAKTEKTKVAALQKIGRGFASYDSFKYKLEKKKGRASYVSAIDDYLTDEDKQRIEDGRTQLAELGYEFDSMLGEEYKEDPDATVSISTGTEEDGINPGESIVVSATLPRITYKGKVIGNPSIEVKKNYLSSTKAVVDETIGKGGTPIGTKTEISKDGELISVSKEDESKVTVLNVQGKRMRTSTKPGSLRFRGGQYTIVYTKAGKATRIRKKFTPTGKALSNHMIRVVQDSMAEQFIDSGDISQYIDTRHPENTKLYYIVENIYMNGVAHPVAYLAVETPDLTGTGVYQYEGKNYRLITNPYVSMPAGMEENNPIEKDTIYNPEALAKLKLVKSTTDLTATTIQEGTFIVTPVKHLQLKSVENGIVAETDAQDNTLTKTGKVVVSRTNLGLKAGEVRPMSIVTQSDESGITVTTSPKTAETTKPLEAISTDTPPQEGQAFIYIKCPGEKEIPLDVRTISAEEFLQNKKDTPLYKTLQQRITDSLNTAYPIVDGAEKTINYDQIFRIDSFKQKQQSENSILYIDTKALEIKLKREGDQYTVTLSMPAPNGTVKILATATAKTMKELTDSVLATLAITTDTILKLRIGKASFTDKEEYKQYFNSLIDSKVLTTDVLPERVNMIQNGTHIDEERFMPISSSLTFKVVVDKTQTGKQSAQPTPPAATSTEDYTPSESIAQITDSNEQRMLAGTERALQKQISPSVKLQVSPTTITLGDTKVYQAQVIDTDSQAKSENSFLCYIEMTRLGTQVKVAVIRNTSPFYNIYKTKFQELENTSTSTEVTTSAQPAPPAAEPISQSGATVAPTDAKKSEASKSGKDTEKKHFANDPALQERLDNTKWSAYEQVTEGISYFNNAKTENERFLGAEYALTGICRIESDRELYKYSKRGAKDKEGLDYLSQNQKEEIDKAVKLFADAGYTTHSILGTKVDSINSREYSLSPTTTSILHDSAQELFDPSDVPDSFKQDLKTGAIIINIISPAVFHNGELMRQGSAEYISPAQFQKNSKKDDLSNTTSSRQEATKVVLETLKASGLEITMLDNSNPLLSADVSELLKTTSGTIYGMVKDGKIYLGKEGLNPNTPIHEYTHLWAEAMMKNAPQEWKNIVSLLKNTNVWEEVTSDDSYVDIKDNQNAIASEVLARISGRQNSERITKEIQKTTEIYKNEGRIADSRTSTGILLKLKEALSKFWNWVGTNLFNIHFTSTSQLADRVLYDLVNQTDLTGTDGLQHQLEINRIIEQAKIDGTYMKAPNGNPTNLTERGWAEVRTKAFKEWFGDWENAVLYTSWNVNDTAALESKYPSSLPTKFYHHTTNKFGKQVYSARQGEQKRLHIIGRLTTDKVDVLVVENPDSTNKISHITLATAEGVKPVESNSELEKYSDKITPLDDYIETTFTNNLKRDVSKIVDENGEPKEVYHGSRFTGELRVFDASKSDQSSVGSNTENAAKMNFFTDSQDTAEVYAEDVSQGEQYTGDGQVIPAFLNIKNPKIIDFKGRNWNGTGITAEYYDALDEEWVPITKNGNPFFATEVDAMKFYRAEHPSAGQLTDRNWRVQKASTVDATNIQVEKALKDGNDGLLIQNVAEAGQGSERGSIVATDYVTLNNPNQIKSSTDNQGTYSTASNDIYYQREVVKTLAGKQKYIRPLTQEKEQRYLKSSKLSTINRETLQRYLPILDATESEQPESSTDKFQAYVQYLRFNDSDIFKNSQTVSFLTQADFHVVPNIEKRGTFEQLIAYLFRKNMEDFIPQQSSIMEQLFAPTLYDRKTYISRRKQLQKYIKSLIKETQTEEFFKLGTKIIPHFTKRITDRILREFDSFLPTPSSIDDIEKTSGATIRAYLKLKNSADIESPSIFPDRPERTSISYQEMLAKCTEISPIMGQYVELIHKLNPSLFFTIGGERMVISGGEAAGWFNINTNTIVFPNGTTEDVMWHELAHAISIFTINYSTLAPGVQKRISKFMDYLTEYLDEQQIPESGLFKSYAYTNPAEFIAELYGNSTFRDLLRTIPPMKEPVSSLFSEIWDEIKNFLTQLFSSSTNKATSALDYALQMSDAIFAVEEYQSEQANSFYKNLRQQTVYDEASFWTSSNQASRRADFIERVRNNGDLSLEGACVDTLLHMPLDDLYPADKDDRYIIWGSHFIQDSSLYPAGANQVTTHPVAQVYLDFVKNYSSVITSFTQNRQEQIARTLQEIEERNDLSDTDRIAAFTNTNVLRQQILCH